MRCACSRKVFLFVLADVGEGQSLHAQHNGARVGGVIDNAHVHDLLIRPRITTGP